MNVRDPFVRVTLVLLGMTAAGGVALGIAWHGAAATLDVWTQVPFVVSGGVAGIALIGTGLGLLTIHLDRRAAADEAAILDDAVHDAADLAESLRSGRPSR